VSICDQGHILNEKFNDQLQLVQAAQEKSRDRFADLYDFAPVGYLTLNVDEKIDEINLTGASLLGVERNKLPFKNFVSFVAAEHQDCWHRHFLNVLTRSDTLTCDLTLKRDDGSRLHVQLDCLRLIKSDNMPVVRIALIDTTKRNAVYDSLRESNLLFSSLAKISPVGIYRTGAQNNFIYVSNNWCSITGMNSANVIGQSLIQAIHPDDRQRVGEALYTSRIAHINFLTEYRFQRPNGEICWVEGEAVAEQNKEEGSVIGYVGTVTDITNSKRYSTSPHR